GDDVAALPLEPRCFGQDIHRMERLDRRLALNCQFRKLLFPEPDRRIGAQWRPPRCCHLRHGNFATAAGSPGDGWPHQRPRVVSITRARAWRVVRFMQLLFLTQPLPFSSMTRITDRMATDARRPDKTARTTGTLRRAVTAATAALLSCALALPAHAQGKVAV